LNKIADLSVGQIRISVSAVPRIKRELERLGYRESSLFPELEKIGAEVRRDFAGSSASLPSTPKKRRLPAVDGSEPPRTKRSKAKKVVTRKPPMKKAARKKST